MTLAIVQARLGSTRLPGKALMPIAGKPLISHVCERVTQIRGVDHVVLAVPALDVHLMPRQSWHVMGFHRLNERNVLGRFYAVLGVYPACETVVRVTGDCPLFNPEIGSAVLEMYQHCRERFGCAYASNILPGYTDGEDVEVFSADILRSAFLCAHRAEDQEHVTPWIRRHAKCVTMVPWQLSTGKTSVDTLEDLERVRALAS